MSTHYFDTRPAYLRAPPGINTDKATAAVFDTNELLYLIIDAVPREHRTPLLRTSHLTEPTINTMPTLLPPQSQMRQPIRSTTASRAIKSTITPERAFDATDAVGTVFGIPELLILIVSGVPPNSRTSLRRVSKTWHAAVIKVGHTLKPVGYGWGTRDGDIQSVPGYSVESGGCKFTRLKLNRSSGLPLKKEGYITRTFWFAHYGVKRVAFDPPITQVLICENAVEVVTSGPSGVAILRVPEGIRVGDLLECLRKLEPVRSRSHTHAKYYVRFAWQLQWTDEDEGRLTAPRPLPQTPWPPQTPPAPRTSKPLSFEATTAVLDTNDLLHLTIFAVPREYRTALRRVSKNWQAAVLKIGHVFEPIYHNWYFHDFAVEKGFFGLGPTYALEDEFAVNPVLLCSSRTYDGVEPDYELGHSVDFVEDFSLAELTGRKYQFITDPPLSHVMIHAEVFDRQLMDAQVANLRVREGIRIEDLLESASFAVRYYFDESKCEIIWVGSGSEGGDLGEAEGGDGREGGEGEVEVEQAGQG
ncbi:hypothetical protein Q7P36_008621 [Cladosporium allicinum]